SVSWAARGARVTAIDFSAAALGNGSRLAAECGVEVRFVESTVYDLPRVLHESFDVVFTSWGAVTWLDDISHWAAVATSFVRPGGFLYVAEFHPFGYIFDETSPELRVKYPYFPTGAPIRDDSP